MRTLISLLTLSLLLCLACGVRADTPAVADYVLGPADVLDITVDNHPDLNKTATVLSDGTISFPEVGILKAAGKTPAELATEIQGGLEKTLNNCGVVVAVKEVHSRRVKIAGGVKASGAFDLTPNAHLMDLVALAGGLDTKPTRISGHLVRGGEVINLNIPAAVAQPDSEANILLQPNDLILLDEQDIQKQIHVLGEVTKPGPYDLTENTTVVSLVSESGPPTDKAALSQAYILRGQNQIPMNLLPILNKNVTDPNVIGFKLQPGDVLFVPTILKRYAVLGDVAKPGYYPLSEKQPTTVLDALSLAGGQLSDADMRKASILHMVDGKPVAHPVNIDAMLKKAKLASNVELGDGDILYIPKKSSSQINVGSVWAGLSILTLFGFKFH